MIESEETSDSIGAGRETRLSRAEIEIVCMLHAVLAGPCSAINLAERLGLAPELAVAVEQALAPLLGAGYVVRYEDIFSLTDAGRERLRLRLSESKPNA